jgi:hypothetical protein
MVGPRRLACHLPSLSMSGTGTLWARFAVLAAVVCLLALSRSAPALGNADLYGSSLDGKRVYFLTEDRLVPADRDDHVDVYGRWGGRTRLISTSRLDRGRGPEAGYRGCVWWDKFGDCVSDDGRAAIFETKQRLVRSDHDRALDVYVRRGGHLTLASKGEADVSGPGQASSEWISGDGSAVFFETDEQLEPSDTDGCVDLYVRRMGSTKLLTPYGCTFETARIARINGTVHASSADGSRVALATEGSLDPADDNTNPDVYAYAGGHLTWLAPGLSGPGSNLSEFAGASRSVKRIFFNTFRPLFPDDTAGASSLYGWDTGETRQLGHARLGGITPDGSRVFGLTDRRLVPADDDGEIDIYELTDGEPRLVTPFERGARPEPMRFDAVSSDGRKVIFSTAQAIVSSDDDHRNDIYAAGPAGSPKLLTPGFKGGVRFDAASESARRVVFDANSGISSRRPDVYAVTDSGLKKLTGGPVVKRIATEYLDETGYEPILSFQGASVDAKRVFFGLGDELLVTVGDDVKVVSRP